MPDHFHLLITPKPTVSIEKAIQFIKGGFSFRAKKELQFTGEVWQSSFYDHRVRDASEYARFRNYIQMNPCGGALHQSLDFPFSSVRIKLDEVPHWLKPAA
jgi:putative transposase